MENLGVKVEYIFHSGFTVETRNHFLIFDYYHGDLKLKDKKTYIFSTHSHYDHFNPDILDLKGDIKYRQQRIYDAAEDVHDGIFTLSGSA